MPQPEIDSVIAIARLISSESRIHVAARAIVIQSINGRVVNAVSIDVEHEALFYIGFQ